MAAGSTQTCLVEDDGGVICWSNGGNPAAVAGLSSGVAQVTVGVDFACALTDAGGVKCWGSNPYGALGDGTTTDRATPGDVVGLTSGVAAVSAGQFHACALTHTGAVMCWGMNEEGELGNGTVVSSSVPVAVSGLSTGIASLATGWSHNCAVRTTGGITCWGYNAAGQLGDGTLVARLTPVEVLGLPGSMTTVATGQDHTCALTEAGGMLCWGGGVAGQLGDGTSQNRLNPTGVVGLSSGVVGMTLGTRHTCALTDAGAVSCWGYNMYGPVGPDAGLYSAAPVAVVGLSSGVVSIAGFYLHNCALRNTGGVTCWGWNWGTRFGGSLVDVAISPVVPVVIAGTVAVLEGGTAPSTMAVPVSLSSATRATVSVRWTTLFVPGAAGDQADPASDYVPVSGTVTFAPGEVAKTVSVTVNGDTLVEPDEYVVVSFHDPTNAVMGGFWGLGFAVITNDDT